MARILVYGWLFVLAPFHVGMAAPLIHPSLDRQEHVPVTPVAVFVWLLAVSVGLRNDAAERSWAWARRRLLGFYLAPLLFVSSAHVGILAYEAGEFGGLYRDCFSMRTKAHPELPRYTPPEEPWPALRRVTGILAAWLSASVWLLGVLCEATPAWLWLFALTWGLVRYEP